MTEAGNKSTGRFFMPKHCAADLSGTPWADPNDSLWQHTVSLFFNDFGAVINL
jgi:hypothetical protein